MTEEKEDSDQQEIDEGYRSKVLTKIPIEMKIRLENKCEDENVSMQSIIRHFLESFLEEDERIDFLVERARPVEQWSTWRDYMRDQKEKEEELHAAFTEEEVEDIFAQIEKERNDDL